MYKATIRALMRHSVQKLNSGDYSMLSRWRALASRSAFPGREFVGDHVPASTCGTRPAHHPSRDRRGQSVRGALRERRRPVRHRGHPRQRRTLEHDGSRFMSTASFRPLTEERTSTTIGPCCSWRSDGVASSGGRTTKTPNASPLGTPETRRRRNQRLTFSRTLQHAESSSVIGPIPRHIAAQAAREIIPGTAGDSMLVPTVDMRGLPPRHRRSGSAVLGRVDDVDRTRDMRASKP